MTAAKTKRRPSQRREKPSLEKVNKKDPEWFKGFSVGNWIYEMLAIICLCIGLFIAVSVLSERSFSTLGISKARGPISISSGNIMGPFGHFVATMLFGFLGWSSLVPSLGFLLASVVFWHMIDVSPEKRIKLISRWRFFFGVLGALLGISTSAALFWDSAGGGVLGDLLAGSLRRLVGFAGAGLVVAAIVVFSLGLITQKGSLGVLSVMTNYLYKGISWALQLSLTILLSVWYLVSDLFVRAFEYYGGRDKNHSDPDKLEIPLKPKRRKNSIDISEEQSFEDAPSAQTGAALAADVVVKRRLAEAKYSERMTNSTVKQPLEKKVEKVSVAASPYEPPDINILKRGETYVGSEDDDTLRKMSALIEEKLRDFQINGRVTEVHPGPVITLFEFEPAAGVKVGRIAALQDDLAMSLKASSIRIIAPIPKKGTVGIEVPNRQREIVRLRDLLESDAFVNAESTLCIPIGKDTYGEPVVADIATMPHLLMAGTTGTGKSVCINAVLISLLYRTNPSELGLILIDPKILELSTYEGVPHLKVPVVTVPKQARAVLEWAVQEMNKRYRLMQRYGVRNIDGYNAFVRGEEPGDMPTPEIQKAIDKLIPVAENEIPENGAGSDDVVVRPISELGPVEVLEQLPKIVIVIDELADLMLSVGREIEDLITRLAQKARAAGIHLIVATQRPSVDVVTGLIKANFPARMSFRVSSRIDSRTILDSMGAEKLLGRGDMLVMLPGAEHIKRVHGAYISDSEVKHVVQALRKNTTPQYDQAIMNICEKALLDEDGKNPDQTADGEEYDEFYDQAVKLVVEKGQASTSMIQRAFRIGYNRAARIVELMEKEGIVGPMDGVKGREVLLGNTNYAE